MSWVESDAARKYHDNQEFKFRYLVASIQLHAFFISNTFYK